MATSNAPASAPKAAKDHEVCEKAVLNALQNSSSDSSNPQYPFIRHLIGTMDGMGCIVSREFFKCRPCERPVQGFYDSRLGIVLCENNLKIAKNVEDTITHELTHSFDNCRAQIDTNDCHQVACAEIRAASLSGECLFDRELLRGQFHLYKHFPECVKRRATAATASLPQCKPKADFYVKKVFNTCYKDTAPFETHPHL